MLIEYGVLSKYKIQGALSSRDLDEKFDLIVEANDQLLEKINGDLDEAAGMKKRLDPVVQTVSASTDGPISGRWNVTTNRTVARSPSQTIRLMTANNIERPQLSFKQRVDNTTAAFVPIITDKPHALRPLAVLLETDDQGLESFSHPYEFELERFQPPEWALRPASEPTPPSPADQAPVTMVTSPAGLEQLVKELSRESEVAVDLEHHSYRSYLGLTCLIQISTRTRDYIVDALQLRGQLQPLNEVFANPNIVKVFHGADSDVEWLQRDCGLYLVHLFDTHQACKVLAFPRLSLAYLLQHFCNVTADKRFQLADWRIRPLPENMVRYAQEDTHYLLYIYDRMRNLLLEKGNEQKNLIRSVYTNSTLVCLKKYQKPVVRADSHVEMYRRSKKSFSNKQMAALAQLYKWRDETARIEDESTQYVLPNHMLLQISELLPREMQGLLACCSPVPPLLRQNLAAVHKMVLTARSLQHVIETRADPAILVEAPARSRDECNSVLHNRHDTSHLADGDRVNVPMLLCPGADDSLDTSAAEEVPTPSARIKEAPDLDVFAPERAVTSSVGEDWISPYRRYLMMKESIGDEKVVRRMAELTEMTLLSGVKRKDTIREAKKGRKAHKRKRDADGAERYGLTCVHDVSKQRQRLKSFYEQY
ncbi:exosome component 10-like [Pollicipes pollicipes]|uniref:exosome component 10-like n=1 Tax=Pollicipes pollicipes TaxID=41117 RepID=UPI0018853BEB|nr:exosome component 10-like [Pollicipes pollicipes]